MLGVLPLFHRSLPGRLPVRKYHKPFPAKTFLQTFVITYPITLAG